MEPFVQFLVRTQGDPLTYLHSIRAAIASVASDQQISTSGFNCMFRPTRMLNGIIPERSPTRSCLETGFGDILLHASRMLTSARE